MTELHFSSVTQPFSTKITEAVYYDAAYFCPTWINGVFFSIAASRPHDQGNSGKKEFIVSRASEGESITIMLTNMAANRWAWCWRSSWELICWDNNYQAEKRADRLLGPEIHRPPLTHLLQHDHVSESFPKSSTDFRPSIQTREPMGSFSFQPPQGTNPGRVGMLGFNIVSNKDLFQSKTLMDIYSQNKCKYL